MPIPPSRAYRRRSKLFDFAELRRDGFDHIRLLIDVGPLLAARRRQLNAVMTQLHTVIAELHRHGLAVLVTLLPPAPGGEVAVPLLDGLRGPSFERYVTLSVRIAAELAAVKSGVVALEPMNEPQTECRASDGPDWTAYQEILVAKIRRARARPWTFSDRRLLVERRGNGAARHAAAARSPQLRQRAFL